MFLAGEYILTVKNKRLKLPSRWELGNIEGLALYYVKIKGEAAYLSIRTEEEAERFTQNEGEFIEVMEKEPFVLEDKNLLVIPDSFLERLPLKDVVVIGCCDIVEIHDNDTFEKQCEIWTEEKKCQAYIIALGVNDIYGRKQNVGKIGATL